jgi:GT2 family glycosyltransferase
MDSRTKSTGTATDAFVTQLIRLDETRFCGHAFWPESPHLHFVVEFLLDGEPNGLVRAEQYSNELQKLGISDGYHGFVYVAKKRQLTGHRLFEARLANLAIPVGKPIDLALEGFGRQSISQPGTVEWLGGLRLAGTIANNAEVDDIQVSSVKIYERNILVAEAPTQRWAPRRHSADSLDALRFDIHLPPAYADGRPHTFRVTDSAGREFEGSPVVIQAFDDGLRRQLQQEPSLATEETRAEWFDRFLPMSLPFENYEEWKSRFSVPNPNPSEEAPVRIIIVGGGDADEALRRLTEQTHKNWSAVTIASSDRTNFDWSALNEALSVDSSDYQFAIFLDATTELRTDAIACLTRALVENEHAVAAYSDIDVTDEAGVTKPVFFGAFDYERMLEQGYAANFFALRIGDISIPTQEKTGSLARLFLAVFDRDGAGSAEKIVHVPGAFAKVMGPSQADIKLATTKHLQKRRVAADISNAKGSVFSAVRVRRKYADPGVVSIVIPTRDRIDLLEPCIESIHAKTKHIKYEIVIVDNGSASVEAHRYLKARHRKGDQVVSAPGPFNYSYLNNAGVAAARGKTICLLNNDTEILDSDWLEELLSRLADPTVGAVSPRLVWPNKVVQNGGVVLGPNFAASDAFNDCMDIDPGYGDLLRVAHESTAVTAACMLVRREDYLAIKGFDELAFPVLFNDVDFCLRLRAYGKRIIFTPHVSLKHHESATRQSDQTPAQKGRFRRELARLRGRWGDVLANDPLYSPFLNLDPYPFSALAWPPRPSDPRFNVAVKPAAS